MTNIHGYLWCLVKEKPQRSLVLQNHVGHTISFNKRNQLPMKKEKNKNKKSVQSNWLEKKDKERVRFIIIIIIIFKKEKFIHFKYMISKARDYL